MKNGIPFDIAFAMSPEEAMACAVIFREMQTGETYDLERGVWIEPVR